MTALHYALLVRPHRFESDLRASVRLQMSAKFVSLHVGFGFPRLLANHVAIFWARPRQNNCKVALHVREWDNKEVIEHAN